MSSQEQTVLDRSSEITTPDAYGGPGLSYAAAVGAAYAACISFVAIVQTLSLNAWQTHGDVHSRLVPAVWCIRTDDIAK